MNNSMNNNSDVEFASSYKSPKRNVMNEGKKKRVSRTGSIGERQDRYQVSKEQVIPKVVALACSLLPHVKQEIQNRQQQYMEGEENDAMILKTTGLDEDMEDGLYNETSSPNNNCPIDYESECRHLPPSAAKALTSLLRSSRTLRYQRDRDGHSIHHASDRDDEDDDDDSVLLGSKELFGLITDLDLRDKEGDAILNSIRNNTLTPPSECVPFWAKNDEDSICSDSNYSQSNNQEQMYDDGVSLATVDDDDLHGELNRLGTVISSLRNDLNVIEASHRSLGGNGYPERRRDFISTGTIELANGLKTWRALGRALAPQDHSEGQDGSRIFDCASSLYWAIAFVWAIAILLAGHVQFSGDVRTFSGFMDVLLKN